METKGKVDVLAVMQNAASALCTREHVVLATHVNDARSAVAELIEAATLVADSVWVERETTANAVRRLRVALSALRSSQGGREGDEGEG